MILFDLVLPSWLFSEIGAACGTQGEMRHGYKNVAGKPQGKRKMYREWENIKIDHGGIGCEGVEWVIMHKYRA
jgi:hypothetical protein